MLQLKRIELQGFKSFCERSEMRFPGAGIAAIVGPNGCGKSNLSDAISWVLGEQSAKTLRAGRMEDVIFAGTKERKPLGMAQVTLTLVDPAAVQDPSASADSPTESRLATNGNGHLPRRPAEITITRRLFRSGESEYLINGKLTRLRDIQDLFLGTGLGPESYAIIEQGRIGQILSTKPQDRRAIIEEAAGVSRFKTKRRLAEAKLEGAKQNLARVFDILEEVSRQVNSLKRQAAKARRYSELRAEMLEQMRRALAGRFRLVESQAVAAALDLNSATAAWQSLTAAVAAREADCARLQDHCFQKEAQLTALRTTLSELKLEVERLRGRHDKQTSQVEEINRRLTQDSSELSQLVQRLDAENSELELSRSRLQQAESSLADTLQALEVKGRQRAAAEAALRDRETAIEALRQQILSLLQQAAAIKNQLAQTEQLINGLERDRSRAAQEEQAARADLDRLAEEKAQLQQLLAERQLELQSIEAQRRQTEEELASHRKEATEVRRLQERLRTETSRLKARLDSLENILRHRTYTTETVKRLFAAIEKGAIADLQPLGVLADFLEVDPQFEKAAEEFLHDELEYVVVRDWEQAARGMDFLRSDSDGRVTFFVHPQSGPLELAVASQGPPLEPGHGILGPLSQFLRATNGLHNAPTNLLPRVARCFIVQDRASGQRLAIEHPDFYFLTPDGVCFHGHAVSGGRKSASGPLALKRELRELRSLHEAKRRELQETDRHLQALEERIHQLSEALERIRGQQQTKEKDALALDHEARRLAENAHRANSRLSVARMDLERLARELENAEKLQQDCRQSLETHEGERRRLETALAEASQSLEALRQSAARTAEEYSALRAEVAGLEERLRAARTTCSRLETSVQQMAERRRRLRQELETLEQERNRLVEDNRQLEDRIRQLTAAVAEKDAELAALVEEETRLRAQLASCEDTLRQERQQAQAAAERRAQVELELVRRQAELKYLDETSRKEANQPIEQLAASQESVLDETATAEAEQAWQDLRARIEALGPVNTQAVEELEEAQQRYEFLNAQRQDLLDSIRDTEKAIQEIDIESRRRFTEAFEAINQNFREMFRTLFNGGLGEMRLTDESNAGESGIDIVASPPGKKLQNVLLLSGGERALTAMALLMAIFQYQPSPFCVLDEVDAPLDEANIERLVRLLKQMSAQTQFIVITHAKRTMEAAEVLYGVTMQEPGVSKLVSVRLQTPQAPEPAQSAEEQPELAAV